MNIQNLRTAVAYLLTVPATQWNMDLYYFTPNKCGCALGHLGANHVAGMTIECSLPSYFDATGPILGSGITAGQLAFDLTVQEAWDLFKRVTISTSTRDLAQMHHKEIFFQRLTRLLENRGIPLSTIFGPEQTEATGPSDEKDSEHAHAFPETV